LTFSTENSSEQLTFSLKGLGAIMAKVGPTSDVDKIFPKMYSQYVLYNTASEHVFIPDINPHCILSQIYALFIEFYYALLLLLFFKDMHYNTMYSVF
jgi:hypothetical protein